MKTKITFAISQHHFGTLMLFFIFFLSSLNSMGQKIQSSLSETWKNGAWEYLSQTIYTYDGNQYLIHDLTQAWDTSWKDSFQTNYTNNPDGTVQQSISQSWNTGTVSWGNLQRTNYTYTAAKKQLTSESEIWFEPDWMFFIKETNTYDSSDYLINDLSQTYDFISPWKNANQTIYSNNPDGTVNQALLQTWNINVWNNTNRITYTYSGSKLVISLSEKWNGTIWENDSKETYNYDSNGYLINSLSQNWVLGAWKNDSQANITNYSDGSPYQIVSQDWDDVAMDWKNVARITMTYSSLSVKDNFFNESFTVYPNPAQEKITIKTNDTNRGQKYWVTDQLGRQFLNGTITDLETVIDVNQLAAGIYFIQMGQQHKKQTIKMVKE